MNKPAEPQMSPKENMYNILLHGGLLASLCLKMLLNVKKIYKLKIKEIFKIIKKKSPLAPLHIKSKCTVDMPMHLRPSKQEQ